MALLVGLGVLSFAIGVAVLVFTRPLNDSARRSLVAVNAITLSSATFRLL
jgi:hypothetical protein